MTWLKDTVEQKHWLFFGSSVGGALCALLIHLNELMPANDRISLGLPMGMALSTALGMIAGLIGGVFGSFISGALAGEDVFLNIGQSLGIGLINGFFVGTLVGVGLGLLHTWKPEIMTPTTLMYFIGGVIALSIIAYAIKRALTKSRSGRGGSRR